jgi:hypothetical protein
MKTTIRSSRFGVALIALGALALAIMPTSVRAESILISLAGPPVANGSNWDWSYTVKLTEFSSLNSGLSAPGPDSWAPDFGEIYDFGSYVAGSASFTATAAGLVNADFSVTTPLADTAAETAIFGPATAEVTDDNVGIENLKLSFVRVAPYTNAGPGDVILGTLTATSRTNVSRFDTYIGTDTKPGGQSGKNSATVAVPVVPTPKTVWAGLALFSVMGLSKARRLVCA